MATSTTFIRTPSGGFFAQAQGGLVPITDPVQLHDLQTGATPSVAEDPWSGNVAKVASPTTPAYALPSSPAAPLPPPPTGTMAAAPVSAATPPVTGSGAGATPSSPYDAFNSNIAGILTQLSAASNAGRATLGGAANALTTESVGAAGGYDPTATPAANLAHQTGTLGAFAPAVTSVNTQLANTDSAMKDLETNIGTIAQTELPTAVSPGQSLVTPGGTTVSQGHSYTPQVNPETGLVDGFDQNTGTWASQDNAGGSPNSSNGTSGNTNISAIFGASNPIGAYAADPNYVSEISGLYSTVSGLGVAGSADSLQTYIQNNAKGSPVTGQMILNAASTYGVDPALLTTVLLHESDFGTQGAAKTTNNPGNVGNTGTSTQSYNSWQQGVMATAKNLSSRMQAAGVSSVAPGGSSAGNTPGATGSSNVGGTFSTADTAKVSKLPSNMQNYVQAGPAGVAYIDDTRIPDALKTSAQTLAAQAGIPYLAAGDVSAMQSIVQAQQNLNLMESTAKTVLGSGAPGYVGDTLATWANSATGGNAFPNFSQFNSYATEAINLIKGLAGGTGSGLRMTQSEIDTAQQNIPNSSDTIQNAMKKVQVLQGLIYTRISSVFPDAQVVMVDPTSGSQGYVPASQYSSAISQGYTTP